MKVARRSRRPLLAAACVAVALLAGCQRESRTLEMAVSEAQAQQPPAPPAPPASPASSTPSFPSASSPASSPPSSPIR